jgi:hypothetical protein
LLPIRTSAERAVAKEAKAAIAAEKIREGNRMRAASRRARDKELADRRKAEDQFYAAFNATMASSEQEMAESTADSVEVEVQEDSDAPGHLRQARRRSHVQ